MFRRLSQLRGGILVWTLLTALTLHGFARDPDGLPGDVPAPPPEANPIAIQVPRGGPVWITLSAYSVTSQITRFRIRRLPSAGKLLGAPVMVNATTGRVKYRPPAGAGPAQDSFFFEVQSMAGVSAPAEVRITITDQDPVFIAPGDIEFGQVLPGETARRRLVVQNIGGGIADGTVRVPDPWSIEGDPDYHLGAGAKQSFTLVFAPAGQQPYTGDIEYTGDPGRATDLNGECVGPLAVTSGTVELTEAGEMRVGTVHIENRTAAPQMLQVAPNPKLEADAAVSVPAKGATDLLIQAKGDDEFTGTLTLTGSGVKFDVPLHAAAILPPEPSAVSPPAPSAAPGPNGAVAANAAPAAASAPAAAPMAEPNLLAPPPVDQSGERTSAGLYLWPLNPASVGQKDAVLTTDFKGPDLPRSYRLEVQTLGIDSHGKVFPQWNPMTNVTLETNGSTITARMQQLNPGTLYVVRIVGLDAQGKPMEWSGVGQVWTAAPWKGGHWLLWTAMLLAAGGGVWAWRRRQYQAALEAA